MSAGAWQIVKVRWPDDPAASVHPRWQETVVAEVATMTEALEVTKAGNVPGNGCYWFTRWVEPKAA